MFCIIFYPKQCAGLAKLLEGHPVSVYVHVCVFELKIYTLKGCGLILGIVKKLNMAVSPWPWSLVSHSVRLKAKRKSKSKTSVTDFA